MEPWAALEKRFISTNQPELEAGTALPQALENPIDASKENPTISREKINLVLNPILLLTDPVRNLISCCSR
jgi:hypothetical protein